MDSSVDNESPQRWPIIAARALLAVAMLAAGYLAWVSVSGGSVAGCGPSSSCDRVLQSRWAYWLRIPVSVPAVVIYAGLWAATFGTADDGSSKRRRRAWLGSIALSITVVGAALWFVGLQIFLLKSFCPFCMTAHAGGFLAAVVLLWCSPLRAAGRDVSLIGKRATAGVVGVGIAGVLILLIGQLLVDTPRYQIKSMADTTRPPRPASVNTAPPSQQAPADATPPPRPASVNTAPPSQQAPADATPPPQPASVNTAPPSQQAPADATPPPQPAPADTPPPPQSPPADTAPPPQQAPTEPALTQALSAAPSPAMVRRLSLHEGAFQLNLDEVPMLGSPDGAQVMVSLFDYSCHLCRETHGLLVEAQRRSRGKLAIVNLPMPLNAGCNDQIKETDPAHRNACEYARLGLAVWRADRSKFTEFDSWMFAPATPPPVAEAKQYAATLVGGEKLERALADEWINQQITTAVAIYARNNRLMLSTKMPQLIIGRAIVVGVISNPDDLDRVLARQFHLQLER